MKRLKLLTTISLGLLGGGLLTSIPLISTSCGDKLANQTISGDKTLSGGQRIAGSQEYNTTATTTATWTIAATDGSQLPNGIKMESNKLTWDDTLSYGEYSITIKCKASNYNDATYPVTLTIEETQEINKTNVANYLTGANTRIFYNGSSSYTVGNQLLKLKEFSAANGNITHYVVTENISFGFLVDPDMDCHISAKPGVTITCNGESNEADGVIVGTTSSGCSGIYTKNLTIDPNVTFIISSTIYATGVYFYSTASGSTQTINGTFTIEASNNNAFGVYFNSTASGNLTINGTFTISSSDNSTGAYGVYFNSTASGNLTINGTFTISSSDSSAYGVCFDSTASGTTIINGAFTISANSSYAFGVCFDSTASGTTTINGTFTITSSNNAYGVDFYSTDSGSTQTINGTFTIKSNANSRGIRIASTASGILTMDGTQFFSNKAPSTSGSNWPAATNNPHYPSWNGTSFTGEFVKVGSGDLTGDNLTLTSISNKNPSPDFTIQVIGSADIDGSKRTFNRIYWQALKDYVESDYCGPIAKEWLKAIIDAIPLS